jgi:hydroxymethylglutaryl-CoA synthase
MSELKFGIDAISFYSSRYYLDLATLANERDTDVGKYYVGIGFRKIAVTPPDEDIITMAATAAEQILQNESKENVDTLIFATESGFDYSKSAGTYLHGLLGLPNNCRAFEIKQACYSATAGLQIAISLLRTKPKSKILLIASDIARYGLNTPGEPSHGSGAIAMLITANPRILAIEAESGVYTEDVLDFWRPVYSDRAIVHGRYSCDLYLRILEKTWAQYQELSGRNIRDFDYFCYHVSVPKLVEKAHKRFLMNNNVNEESSHNIEDALIYGREIGNCYTASLYLSLLSVLENTPKDIAKARIGFYSYGSGCVGEYFSGIVQAKYKNLIKPDYHSNLLANRHELTYSDYENFYNFKLPTDGSNAVVPKYETGLYRLAAVENHKRFYEKVSTSSR